MTDTDTISIPARFNGPPESANGGYACGVFADLIDGDAQATLRAPPPLDRPLTIDRRDDEITVSDGDVVVAHVAATTVDVDVPRPPSLDAAAAATGGWFSADEHFFPTCFTCGPKRLEGDGLRIFPGPTADGAFNASPWNPHRSLVGYDGTIPEPVMWAALDCPGMAAAMQGAPALLGRMAARIDRPVEPGVDYVAFGWSLGRDGRKLYSASAIADGDGRVLAVAQLTSIAFE